MKRIEFDETAALGLMRDGLNYAEISKIIGVKASVIGERLRKLGHKQVPLAQRDQGGRVRIFGEIAVFRMHCGSVCVLDAEDVEILGGFVWRAQVSPAGRLPYVMREAWGRYVKMHREVLRAPPGSLVDHVNGDTLDNRKENLRFATYSGNSQNRGMSARNKSGFKGVSRYKDRWQASIRAAGKSFNLGHFVCPLEAAKAYDKACLRLHGEYARPNFAALDPRAAARGVRSAEAVSRG